MTSIKIKIFLLALLFSPFLYAEGPELNTPEIVIHGGDTPKPDFTNQSNNNLDVIMHNNDLYLAWRTSNNHFASSETVMHVAIKKGDEWTHETSVHTGKDLREPRFLSLNGELFLYFAELGTNPLAFEPGATLFIKKDTTGEWSESDTLFQEDFIPWRIKDFNQKPLMIGYKGGANIYNASQDKLTQYILTTSDGINWTPYFTEDGAILSSGLSETDFVVKEGTIIIVGRNEAGDQDGWGSKICKADIDEMQWTCSSDRRKFDSPLLVGKGDNIFLIARRQVAFNGNYDLNLRWLPEILQDWVHQVAYSLTPKRCSIWEVDPVELSVEWSLDLPSAGDTCFPSAIATDTGFEIYNYSNRWETAADWSWIRGQLGETLIYKINVSF
jgi:hypothetical protein